MKKRLFALLLALCVVLTLLPMGAGAATQLPWEAEPDKWTVLTATSISLYGGNYYLTEDVTILSGMQISGNVTIDLNGHVLKYAGDSDVRVITVNSGKLTLNDSAPNATHTDTTLPAGGVVTNASTHEDGGGGIRTCSTFEMNGGTIYNCSIWELGAGVSVYPNGNFTMNGGAIVDCEIDKGSNDGGGVYVSYNASFTMNGGAIRGCKTSRGHEGGGGVCVAGTFTMNDGTIEDCFAKRGGGGVGILNRCTFEMNGGTIQNCTVEGFGGGVLAEANSIFTMNGGSIENCSATATSGAGGGVHVYGTFNANGGTIRGCTASNGAGVWLAGKMTNTATTVNATIIYSKLEYTENVGSFDGKFVKFMDGENWYAAEIVKDNSTLIKPDDPVRAGWTFVGWYKESTLTTPWNFETDTVRVDSEKYNFLQLYAKWACAGHVDEKPADHKCDTCGETISSCSGGSATCIARPVCSVCGESYGEKDDSVHVNTQKVEEVPATCTTDGCIAHWHCNDCGYDFLDEDCTEPAGDMTIPAVHKWQDATCLQPGICTACGATVGEPDPANHEQEAAWTMLDAQYHKQHYACCDTWTGESEKHDWQTDSEGNTCCRTCGYGCKHSETETRDEKDATCTAEGYTGDLYCEFCGKLLESGQPIDKLPHSDVEPKDHKCDACNAEIGEHKAAEGSHNCAYCGETVSECVDEGKDHKCDVCNAEMGEHEAAEGSHDCEYCGELVSECEDKDNDHLCDVCGEELTECVDEDGDHKCDICGGEVAGAEVPASGDPFALIVATLCASCAGLAVLRKKKD